MAPRTLHRATSNETWCHRQICLAAKNQQSRESNVKQAVVITPKTQCSFDQSLRKPYIVNRTGLQGRQPQSWIHLFIDSLYVLVQNSVEFNLLHFYCFSQLEEGPFCQYQFHPVCTLYLIVEVYHSFQVAQLVRQSFVCIVSLFVSFL